MKNILTASNIRVDEHQIRAAVEFRKRFRKGVRKGFREGLRKGVRKRCSSTRILVAIECFSLPKFKS